MQTTIDTDESARLTGKRQGLGLARRLLIFVLVMLGAGIFSYPSAADWFSTRGHAEILAGYGEAMGSMTNQERQAGFEHAAAFNAALPPGDLRDPYAQAAVSHEHKQALSDEFHVMKTGGSEVIGRVRYDRVGIDLPIYHGTDDEVISKGAGHLDGSSLPIGGPSTHSVLTAHSGLPSARLFTPLHDAELGDMFWVETLGERRWYRVHSITVVDEDDLRELRIAEGRDQVTLFTCTPVGVNSHRLLIGGERIESPSAREDSISDPASAGIAWWAVWLGGLGTVLSLLLFHSAGRRIDR